MISCRGDDQGGGVDGSQDLEEVLSIVDGPGSPSGDPRCLAMEYSAAHKKMV